MSCCHYSRPPFPPSTAILPRLPVFQPLEKIFPIIGKLHEIFSNHWKNSPGFSNHWKKIFQPLENRRTGARPSPPACEIMENMGNFPYFMPFLRWEHGLPARAGTGTGKLPVLPKENAPILGGGTGGPRSVAAAWEKSAGPVPVESRAHGPDRAGPSPGSRKSGGSSRTVYRIAVGWSATARNAGPARTECSPHRRVQAMTRTCVFCRSPPPLPLVRVCPWPPRRPPFTPRAPRGGSRGS